MGSDVDSNSGVYLKCFLHFRVIIITENITLQDMNYKPIKQDI